MLWFFVRVFSFDLFFICVCFLRCFFLCVCVCVDFVCGLVGAFFLMEGGYVVPCSCTKDNNRFVLNVACVVCYSSSKYGTFFLITRVYYGFR